MTRVSATREVGRYEIPRELGRGGTAVVYLARQTDLDRLVALKELAAGHGPTGAGPRGGGAASRRLVPRPARRLGTHRFGSAGVYRAVVRIRSNGGAGARATSTMRVAR